MSAVTGVKRSFAAMSTTSEGQSPPSTTYPLPAPISGDWMKKVHLRSSTDTTAETKPEALRFNTNASIVLTGIRGAGKSTLAVIASSALKRKVVDTERAFLEATGLSSSEYKKSRGNTDYQRRQTEVLRDVLEKYEKNTIIVCSWMDGQVQTMLRQLEGSVLVVHILRDSRAIQQHLKLPEDFDMQALLDASASVFRKCSQFELYNVTESRASEGNDISAIEPDQRNSTPSLTLKRAERHFLKFLSLILPKNAIPFIESAFPLASVPTEERHFTYALSVSFSALLADEIDIEELEAGADAIEIVIDDLVTGPDEKSPDQLSPCRASQISRVLGQVRRNTVIPILLHVLCPDNAALNSSPRNVYLDYVFHGLRLAPEYLSVDLRLDKSTISRVVQAKGPSKVLGNLQFVKDAPSWTDPFWRSHYEKAQNLGCDLVRLTRPALEISDNFDIRHIHGSVSKCGQPKLALIAFNSGRLGRNSACFNRVLTSVIPEGDDGQAWGKDGGRSHLPSISALQATRALFSSFIYDPMELYVFGANVGYSLSPAMHNAAFRTCGIPHHYKPFSTDSISNLLDIITRPHFAGASVGLPFKVDFVRLAHSLSSHARAIGAVNTLIPVRYINEDGIMRSDPLSFDSKNHAGPVTGLHGENTDWIGIRACIRRGLSPANAVRSTSCGLVIGAGGMARAAVYSMLQLGVKNIVVYNRTPANAEKLCTHFQGLLLNNDLPLLSVTDKNDTKFNVLQSRNEQWPNEFRFPTMIVSCIPTHSIGDNPAPNFTLPTQWLNSPTGGVMVELAYKTLDSPLLQQFRHESSRGWVTMDGLDLLPEQGFAQFELFTGRRAPRRVMRREVFKAYRDESGQSNLAQLQPRLNNIAEQES